MTLEHDPKPDNKRPARWRFRFSLKSVFLLVTALCLWLGYVFARQRQADQMIAQHNAVVDAIMSDIATAPANCTYLAHEPSREVLQSRLRYPGSQNARNLRAIILGTGSIGTQGHVSLTIDVTQLLKSMNRQDIASRLAQHYTNGLNTAGLSHHYGSEGGLGFKSRATWASPKNEVTVIVDAHVSQSSPTAQVQILFIDSRQLRLW